MELIKITRRLPGDNAAVLDLPTDAYVPKGDVSSWVARGWKQVNGSVPNGLVCVVKSNPPQKAYTVTRYGTIAHIALFKEQGWTINTDKTYDGDVVKLTRDVPGKAAVRLVVYVKPDDVAQWERRNYFVEEQAK